MMIRSTGARSAMTGIMGCPTDTPPVVMAHHHRGGVHPH
ncbi:hypothetical protein F750_6977 [Streptomyces sp. PAMC 26508]|nr:hypothetical protein F750_6977 [Streptomyces sp. PAMC 26508]